MARETARCDRLTRLVGLFNRFRLEEFLEVWLTVKRALVALVIVHVELLATLDAPEAILVPDQTLGLCLFHLEDDLAAAATVWICVAILTHLLSKNSIIPLPRLFTFFPPPPSFLPLPLSLSRSYGRPVPFNQLVFVVPITLIEAE